MASFITAVRQMNELFQWPKCLTKKWPKCFCEKKNRSWTTVWEPPAQLVGNWFPLFIAQRSM